MTTDMEICINAAVYVSREGEHYYVGMRGEKWYIMHHGPYSQQSEILEHSSPYATKQDAERNLCIWARVVGYKSLGGGANDTHGNHG